jgi:hypothetical protein
MILQVPHGLDYNYSHIRENLTPEKQTIRVLQRNRTNTLSISISANPYGKNLHLGRDLLYNIGSQNYGS